MTETSSQIQLIEIELEGLSFEITAELNMPDNPVVFVDVLSEDRRTLQKFIISPKGLGKISKVLKEAAEESKERHKAFWRKNEATL